MTDLLRVLLSFDLGSRFKPRVESIDREHLAQSPCYS